MNSSKKVSKITGPALSRINSVISSARTVVNFGGVGVEVRNRRLIFDEVHVGGTNLLAP